MYIGLILLGIFIIILACGFLRDVLKRWRIKEQTVLLVSLLILGGLLIKPINIADTFIFSIGGFVIPFIASVILLARADSAKEVFRTLLATIIIGAISAAIIYYFPIDNNITFISYSLFVGIIAGGIAFLVGRSRRGAFVSAALGTMLVSVFEFLIYLLYGYGYVINLGSGQAFSTTIISAMVALLVAEVAGETLEYSKKGRTDVEFMNIDRTVNKY